jgi:hypothetical protein
MKKQFTLIISSLGNDNYTINFRCWVLTSNGDQETISSKVDNSLTFEQALTEQENFINENK